MSSIRSSRRPTRQRVLGGVAVALLVSGALAIYVFRRQIGSYLTHWKGGPPSTTAYEPFDSPPLFHLAAAGDTGDAGRQLDGTGAVIAEIGAEQPFDALLLLGDIVYPAGDPEMLQQVVYDPFAGVLDQGADLLAILGNHDVKSDQGDVLMDELGMPGRYWLRTYADGEVVMIGLDSTTIDDPQQVEFLTTTLAESTATWKIVAVHHPPYSAGYQGSSLSVRLALAPIFEQYGVQLVLSGHDHDYQRSTSLGGVTYVVSGGGSGVRRTGEQAFTAVSYAFLHYTDIAVFADRMVIRAVGQDGTVADESTLFVSPAS